MVNQLIVGFVLLLASSVLAILGFLGARVLKGLDANQQTTTRELQALSDQHAMLSKDFYRLEGACEVNHKRRLGDLQ